MSSLFLTPEEINDLTGRSRRDAQARALNAMGITHRARPDGSLVVSRDHVDRLLGGLSRTTLQGHAEPNWNAAG